MDYAMVEWLDQNLQVPLVVPERTGFVDRSSVWIDSLMIPVYFAALTVAWQRISNIQSAHLEDEDNHDDVAPNSHAAGLTFSCPSIFKRLVMAVGGCTILMFRIAQCFCVLALFVLSILRAVKAINAHGGASGSTDAFPVLELVQCLFYVIILLLSLMAILGSTRTNIHTFYHVSSILAVMWGVYVYRDVWPLATVNLVPADASEGSLLWIQVGLLTVSGIVIPLFSPRKHIPVDAKDHTAPSAEQTASLFSLLLYGFMEPLIWSAQRLPRLTYDMLPPLADYDRLQNLVGRAFPYMDPTRAQSRSHMGWVVIRVFWFELFVLSAVTVAGVVSTLAGPISIHNILLYLESGRAEMPIKPWLWVVLFFAGRLFKDVSTQWFQYHTARVTVRIQAIITQLVFEHALRIRLKADVEDTPLSATSDSATLVENPDNSDFAAIEDTVTEGDSNGPATAESSRTVTPTANAPKGKGKSEDVDPRAENPAAGKSTAKDKNPGQHLIGRMNNLVSSDLNNLENMITTFVLLVVESPIQILLCIFYLHQILGWSALVGFAAMIITLPLPGWLSKLIQGSLREKMKQTDSRVQTVTEMMNVIRMIKMFGWEPRITEQLDRKREDELLSVRRSKLLTLAVNVVNLVLPMLIMTLTFFTYTAIMKKELTASRLFASIAVFEMLRVALQMSFFLLPQLIQAKVSLERIADFLRNTELIDAFETTHVPESRVADAYAVPENRKDVIGIRSASFTWSKDCAHPVAPGGTRKRTFVLNVDDELVFQRGKLNLIVGPTGAGKTSLLMALLGEMHYIPAGPDSYVNLPRKDGVAYAAQESWVQNDTIKNNILFGALYDETRYNKVLHQCALRRDLSLFDAADETEVGEKGITLSGGQKARITLARAVYSQAAIVLLDDILAALDVHTSKWIVEKCLKGDLLEGRTIILVTHNVVMVSPISDFVVDMGSDGRILSQGTLSSAFERDSELLAEVTAEREKIERAEEEADGWDESEDGDPKQNSGKLVVTEEVEEGRVGWSALKLFLGNLSKRPVLFWCLYTSGHVVWQSLANLQTWYLGYWASQYETRPVETISVSRYLTTYLGLVALGITATVATASFFVISTMRAARIVHKELVVSILGTTLRWLDKTPTSRIIARCTQDIDTLDNRFARATEQLFQVSFYTLFKLLVVLIFSPVFILPALVVGLFSAMCGRLFMKAQLSVKRELSNARAPVLAHFGATISGITSVRAYGAQEAFKIEAYRRIDNYTRVAVTHWNLNQWLSSRIELAACLFSTSLALYLTYFSNTSASNAGFSLTAALVLGFVICHVIKVFNEFEISGNSLERIQQYLLIEHEPKPEPEGIPPAYWPASGQLEVEKLSARYSEDGPVVLHDVSFQVASGERIGIVGRTGSGKSSLTLALLRCIVTEGDVRYDGLDTNKINLDALRSSITIIPQVPELLSGTLRQNLDPFSEHDDAILNDALRSAGLFNLQNEGDVSRITLDTEISGGGTNLSVGQRQVLALARAIVRRSKLLILDEATSAIDYDTDSIIQTSLRTELGKDVTVLTVAHRLQTIMDSDKIIVLDAGHVVEFGKPSELLWKKGGLFRSLVDESSDKDKLYEMVSGKQSQQASLAV